ncbi:type II secretion system protein [Aquisphaera insulae]|uniref:type II secretion system protein n=1 Tax=Aquisphaera insulae TaxID=2712864 RepID=UPI0013EC7D27|nr:prepilin-type N-terminal cleavage/methylation domain-containing protein [Aquisphaera insulae]
MTRPRPIDASPGPRGPRGFTLVELLMVMAVLALLIALLLPAINSAMRTAKSAATGAEINQLAQALAAFKSKYGDYPPSRIYLSERGYYPVTDTTNLAKVAGTTDMTGGQLAQRSLAAMRKFFPRVQFSTSGTAPGITASNFYDFNGNGVLDTDGYILYGHECLVFFLGGIPLATTSGVSVSGFGKDPQNPFSNANPTAAGMYNANRTAPLFEFSPNRLFLDVNHTGALNPAYLDSQGNPAPVAPASAPINFYVYFSSYGNNGYDPNDVNLAETAPAGDGPIALGFRVGFPLYNNATSCISPAPNPYTSTSSYPASGAISFINAQSFQIISSGVDGQYGVGGQYSAESNSQVLPFDATRIAGTTDTSVRSLEKDNITNFHNGRLD